MRLPGRGPGKLATVSKRRRMAAAASRTSPRCREWETAESARAVAPQEVATRDRTAAARRTWAGTVLAARALRELAEVDSEVEAKQNVVRAIEVVAARLGNTRAVCRKSYVHPAVVDAYLDGTFVETVKQRIDAELSEDLADLSSEEAAVLAFLRARLATGVGSDASAT